jgi:hypothetical protein
MATYGAMLFPYTRENITRGMFMRGKKDAMEEKNGSTAYQPTIRFYQGH